MLAILITDAEDAEIILKSKDCLNKPHVFARIIRDGLSVDGLFTIKGTKSQSQQGKIRSLNSFKKCFNVKLIKYHLKSPIKSDKEYRH